MTTFIAAAQVRDLNGCAAVVRAAGHTHSSRSRTSWTWAMVSVSSFWRRAPGAAAGPRSRRPARGRSSAAVRSTARSAPRPSRRSCRRSGPRSPRLGGLDRLHTHEPHRPIGGELAQDPPPMPGRLAGDSDTGEPRRGRPVRGPVQRLAEIPRLAPKRPPGQDPRVVVAHHHHLLTSARSIPTIAFTDGTCSRSRASRALRFRSPARHTITVGHERPPFAMGHQARQAHQEDVPYARPTRRTCSYAAEWCGQCHGEGAEAISSMYGSLRATDITSS